MSDNELKLYYQQYQLILKQQRDSKEQLFNNEQLQQILVQLYDSMEYPSTDGQRSGRRSFESCQTCYAEDVELVQMMGSCQHEMICEDCFHQYLIVRIRDSEIMPWIVCPAESCSIPCHVKTILDHGRLKSTELLQFISTYMNKKLARNENFISCQTAGCLSGFLQFGKPKKEHVTCDICQTKQTVEKGKDGELDAEFEKMIKDGQLRECPACKLLTMKEKGLCNVIECTRCGIWWNWRTKETGRDAKELKQRGRYNGTLWEPGELAYQQYLQRSNLPEFKALLERNGVKYNPNYIRGTES